MNTPFQWTKQIASHLGGVRNPLAVSWPARIKDRGGVRPQFHHVIDIAPTIYEAVGIAVPEHAERRRAEADRRRLDGLLVRLGEGARAAAARSTSRCSSIARIYHDGWWAASRVGIPWEGGAAAVDPDTATWELYNLDEDFSQANDLAAKNPAKLRELQDLWWSEAARYNVLPLDGRKTARLSAELQGRPSLAGETDVLHLLPGRRSPLPAGSAPEPC